MNKELQELFKALGYVGGEIHEITSDGIGFEDLQSLKEIYDNREMLSKGFNVKGDFKALVKGLGQAELAAIVIAAKEGFDLGKK